MGLALAHAYQVISKFKKINARSLRLRELITTARRKQNGIMSRTGNTRLKPDVISVNFNWYHYDDKKEKYCQVRENRGGGRRSISLRRKSTYDELSEIATDTFFPKGKAKGSILLRQHSYYLADFQLEPIVDDGFAMDTYLKENHLKSARFSLMTKRHGRLVIDLGSDDDDDDFEIKTFRSKAKVKIYFNFSIP